MTSRARRLLSRVARRVVGDRAVPLGGLARDRRLLGRALAAAHGGRVVVVGPGLAVRQVLRGSTRVDVVGTSPYRSEVTVCSSLEGPRPLPPRRWDTAVVTDVGDGLDERLRAVVRSCRDGGHLLVFDRRGAPGTSRHLTALDGSAVVEQVLEEHGRRLWVTRVVS